MLSNVESFLNLYNSSDTPKRFSETAYMSPRLFGGPFSYAPQVDPRIVFENTTDTNQLITIGRTMASTLMANPTIVSIAPGKVKMRGLKSFVSPSATVAKLMSTDDATVQSLTDEFSGNKYFYGYQSAWREYANIVNLLCRTMSIMLGIGNNNVMGTTDSYNSYNYVNWQYVQANDLMGPQTYNGEETGGNGFFGKIFSYFHEIEDTFTVTDREYVHFYAGASTDSSDNMSTSTRESSIQSKYESNFDDMTKDIQYLYGDMSESVKNGVMDSITSAFDDAGVGDASGWLNLLKNGVGYLTGQKMIFPLVVDDFTYGKDISISCRFVSPSGDPESIFEYCYVPTAFILALSCPRQLDSARNMYKSPLLVRAYSKGFFNTELGVVTSCRINRGGPDNTSWTAQGLPTEIEVTFDITPLYTNLMLSNTSKVINFLYNDGLIEYLGTMCGANMKGDAGRLKVAMMQSMALNKVTDIPNSILNAVKDTALNNFMQNIKNLP